MHLARIAEYESQQITQFVVWILQNIGINAQAQPLIGSDYNDIGIEYKPSWAVVVPHSDKTYAQLALDILAEFNWTGKETDKQILPQYLKVLYKELDKRGWLR